MNLPINSGPQQHYIVQAALSHLERQVRDGTLMPEAPRLETLDGEGQQLVRDELGIAKDTIVVVWTDHGFHLGDKTTWEKFTLWEESTQVPLIIKVPGVTAAGSVCHSPASLVDLYPTILELCGLGNVAPDSLEGTSLVPQLRDVKAPREAPAICTNGRNNHSIRGERFHLIRYANGDQELYDHSVDEGEWNNLAEDPKHSEVIRRLSRWLPATNAPPAPAGGRNGAGGRTGTVRKDARRRRHPVLKTGRNRAQSTG